MVSLIGKWAANKIGGVPGMDAVLPDRLLDLMKRTLVLLLEKRRTTNAYYGCQGDLLCDSLKLHAPSELATGVMQPLHSVSSICQVLRGRDNKPWRRVNGD